MAYAPPDPRAGMPTDDPFIENPVMDDSPTDTQPISNEDLDAAVLKYVRAGHDRAAGLMEPLHQKWEKYRQLYKGEWDEDDPNDPLSEQQVYIPKLAEFIEFMNASQLRQLLPDPQTMDFVNIMSKWAGMEEYAERSTSLFRNKLRIMRPREANSLYDAMDRILQDEKALGNTVGIIVHDVFDGDSDNDNILEGPCVERIDPLNWYPWSNQVNALKETACTIYSPVSEADLEDMDYIDIEQLMEKTSPRDILRTGKNINDTALDELTGPGDFGYERHIYFGPLPWRAIAKTLDKPEMTRADVVAALAARWDFDPEENLTAKWWTIEWFDDTFLAMVAPYPIALPYGCGPIWHKRFHGVNGQLIGLGMYDRGAWDERLYNAYHRFILRLGALAARPPIIARENLLDKDWLAERDGQYSLGPDDIIKVNQMGNDSKAPFEPLLLNTQVIGLLESQVDRHQGNMEGETHVTNAYRGESNSETATESQNNLQRSMTMDQYYISMWENGAFKDILTRCYVVLVQVMQLTGEPEYAPAGFDEQYIRTFAIYPEHLRGLEFFDVELSGSSHPNNKIHQLQQFVEFVNLYMPTGRVNVDETMRLHLKMLEIRGANKVILSMDQLDMQAMMANVTAALGAGGMQSLDPMIQQQLMAAMGPEAMMQALMPQPQPGQQGGQPNPAGGPGMGLPASPPSVPGLTGGV